MEADSRNAGDSVERVDCGVVRLVKRSTLGLQRDKVTYGSETAAATSGLHHPQSNSHRLCSRRHP